jgi:hypothetical protein
LVATELAVGKGAQQQKLGVQQQKKTEYNKYKLSPIGVGA